MAIQTINNGESGSAVRNKLNSNFSELAADVAASAAQVADAVPLGGATGQVLAKASAADLDTVWVNQTGGGGATNLSTTATPNTVTINSDTGSDATIAAADATNAGVFLPAEKTKLAGIAPGATANSADATLLARANHTGTQLAATISDFAAAVASTPAVAANTAKVSNATHTGDVTGDTALTIAANAVTNTKAADMATATIKGRVTAGTGDPEDLTAAQVRTLLNVADGAQANVATDLSYTAATRLLASSTGADVTLPLVGVDAGLMAAADKTKLDGIAAGATANATDAQLRDRATHTGTQTAATISDFASAADARIAASNRVQSNTTGISGADQITNMVSLTQAEYDAATKNASTLYVIA